MENTVSKNADPNILKRIHSTLTWFLHSDYFIAFIAVTAFVSWIVNLVIPGIIILFSFMAYSLYTQKTMLPLVPMLVLCAYMIPSDFVMDDIPSYWYVGLIAVMPVSGFFFFFIKNRRPFKKSRFLWPALAFCAAVVCSGLFSGYYAKGINFMMIGILTGLYLFFAIIIYNGIDKLDFHYLAKCLFAGGVMIAAQPAVAYLRADSIKTGLMLKTTTEIGWAMSNTAAAALSMCLPAAFYLAAKTPKYNYIFLISAAVFIVGVLFTKSRGGILFMLILLPFSVYYMFKQTPANRRRSAAVSLFGSAAFFILMLIIFWDDLNEVVMYFGKMGMDDTGRFDIYKDAVKAFLKYPVFGAGWVYNTERVMPYEAFYAVHSTVFQYLASGGIFLVVTAAWFFGKRYLTFYADFRPHHVFFLMSLLSHDLYGLIDNTATLPYCIVMACFIFTALEQEIRPEAEKAKRAAFKNEKFHF